MSNRITFQWAVACHECEWTYTNSVKSDVEFMARNHCQSHQQVEELTGDE